MYFFVFRFSRFHHNNFRDTVSWECVIKNDCVRSCLIELKSFMLGKLYIDLILGLVTRSWRASGGQISNSSIWRRLFKGARLPSSGWRPTLRRCWPTGIRPTGSQCKWPRNVRSTLRRIPLQISCSPSPSLGFTESWLSGPGRRVSCPRCRRSVRGGPHGAPAYTDDFFLPATQRPNELLPWVARHVGNGGDRQGACVAAEHGFQ